MLQYILDKLLNHSTIMRPFYCVTRLNTPQNTTRVIIGIRLNLHSFPFLRKMINNCIKSENVIKEEVLYILAYRVLSFECIEFLHRKRIELQPHLEVNSGIFLF